MFPPAVTAIAILFSGLFARPADDSGKMVSLFGSGNATEIAAYFSGSVQLSTPGKDGVYSRAQAKMILAEFFSSNKPQSARLVQQGKSENGAHFMVLSLSTSAEVYKVTLFYRGNAKTMRIHELKIEK